MDMLKTSDRQRVRHNNDRELDVGIHYRGGKPKRRSRNTDIEADRLPMGSDNPVRTNWHQHIHVGERIVHTNTVRMDADAGDNTISRIYIMGRVGLVDRIGISGNKHDQLDNGIHISSRVRRIFRGTGSVSAGNVCPHIRQSDTDKRHDIGQRRRASNAVTIKRRMGA